MISKCLNASMIAASLTGEHLALLGLCSPHASRPHFSSIWTTSRLEGFNPRAKAFTIQFLTYTHIQRCLMHKCVNFTQNKGISYRIFWDYVDKDNIKTCLGYTARYKGTSIHGNWKYQESKCFCPGFNPLVPRTYSLIFR